MMMLNSRTVLLLSSVFFLFATVSAFSQPFQVLGTVRGPAGQPVVGAAVELLPLAGNYERNRLLLEGRTEPAALALVATDSRGRFRLEAPPGIFKVLVRSPGHVAMAFSPLSVSRSLELPPVSLPRDAGTRIEVFDGGGQPVPGAGIYVTRSAVEATRDLWRTWSKDGWRAQDRRGWTGRDGGLALSRLEGEWLDVSVFPPGSATPIGVREVEGVRLVLEPATPRRRTLEVVRAPGQPLAGVLVAVGTPAWPAGITDDRGRLIFADRSSSARVELLLMTAAGEQLSTRMDSTSPPAPIVWPAPIVFRGVLVDSVTQSPLAGALVWSNHDPGGFVFTGADGRFAVDGIDKQSSWIQIEADGFLPRIHWIDPDRLVENQVEPLALTPAAAVAGRVMDSSGQPVAGVELTARLEAPAGGPGAFRLDPAAGRAASDARGQFTLTPLRPGASYELTATHRRLFSTVVTVGGLEPDQPRQVRIEIPERRVGVGRVVDRLGQPIDQATTACRPAMKEGSGKRLRQPWRLLEEIPDDPALDGWSRVLTDPQGRYEIPELPAHRVDLLVWRDGFAPLVVGGVEVPSGKGPVDLGTLVLEPAAALEGVVLDAEGRPLEEVSIWAYERSVRSADLRLDRLSREPANAISSPDGRFQVPDLEPGTALDLIAYRAGTVPSVLRQVVAPSAEPIVVVLDPSVHLDGQIRDPDGRPIAGGRITLRVPEPAPGTLEVRDRDVEDERSARSDAAGSFALEDIRPGSYQISASAEGFQPALPMSVKLSAEEPPRRIVLVLERGAVLEGRTLTAAGEPVGGARVLVGGHSSRSDPGGRYRATGIPLGQQTVEVRHDDHNRLLAEIEIGPGRNELDLIFDPTHWVRGRIIDPDGRPVADARVELRSEAWRNSRHYRASSGEEGRFELPRVADGEYQLTAQKAGYVNGSLADPVEVLGEGVDGLQVRLARGATIAGRILNLALDELAALRIVARGGDGRLHAGRVDLEGGYEIGDLAPGDWRVTATLGDGGRQAQAAVTLEPGVRRLRRDLEFEPGLVLTGQVLYDLEPLRAAAVAVVGHDLAIERQVRSDYLGRFRIEDLRPDRYRLTVSSARELVAHSQDLDLRSDRDLLVEIDTSRVSGTVTSDGEPLPNALVALRQMQGGEGRSLSTVGTDADGFFALARLTAGRYHLTVRKDGYAMAEEFLDVVANVDLLDRHFELVPTQGLDLVARFASGRIPAYVTVAITEPSGRTLLAESRGLDADGSVRFPTVPAGHWQVLVGALGAATRSLTVRVPGDPIEVVLSPAGRLRVRVPELMEPPRRASLTLGDVHGGLLRTIDPGTGAALSRWPVVAGTAQVEGVPEGTWVVRVETSDGQSWTELVAVDGAGETTLTLAGL